MANGRWQVAVTEAVTGGGESFLKKAFKGDRGGQQQQHTLQIMENSTKYFHKGGQKAAREQIIYEKQ